MADADRSNAHDAPRRREARPARRPSLVWIVVLALFWFALAHPPWDPWTRGEVWIAGIIGVGSGLLLHLGLGGRSGTRTRPRGVLGFVPFFLGQMVRGGLDVSRRALHPALPLDPGLLHYRTRLPEGLPRTFFVNTISLLPGTFSARVRQDEITVHRLAPDIAPPEMLGQLEARIGALFGIDIQAAAEDSPPSATDAGDGTP